MDILMKIAEQPAIALVGGGIALGILVVMRALQNIASADKDEIPGLDAMLSAGRYRDAAVLCLRHERFTEAQELFLRAQEPARAAQIAARLGNHRLAGELYERGGELRRAAASYERAGMGHRARELLATADQQAPVAQQAPRRQPTGEHRAAAAPAAMHAPGEATSSRKAQSAVASAEQRFRAMLAKGPSDDATRIEMQQVAQQAAEETLAAGEIRKAAEVYRDAGLTDEAVHLYANVLGMPGEAAVLVAARGHHDRAAELFELAGQKERAAASWVECARKDGKVEHYIDRIERLDPKAAYKALEEATSTRAASSETAEVYYRYGRMLETLGERVRALEVMSSLARGVGGYRDVSERIEALQMAETRLGSPGAAARTGPKGTTARSNVNGAAASETFDLDEPQQPRVQTVVVQNFQIGHELRPEDVQALAREAATAAQVQARRSVAPAVMSGRSSMVSAVFSTQGGRHAQGLESAPMAMELLADAEVRAAREGPSLEALRRYAGSSGCNLSNIEVYYRMGLLCLAMGDWNAALSHFDAVDETSPGYRDALRRAVEIRRWQKSMAGKITLSGGQLQEGGGGSSRYELRGELGRGGMAVVYRATDTVLGRDVALKFIAESALEKKEVRELFLREARSVAQLNHPNIVTIYDVGTLEGRTFIAMEFVEGKTVDDLVIEQKKLPIVEALRITAQVLASLEYAHGRHIVHRDIKPSNMMRSSTGMVKLMDFGLAKSLTVSCKASMIAGTPAYMPPEQFAGTHVDHRADLYAVGVSLYEMLTGELPFEGYVRVGPPPSLRERFPHVPAAIDDALRVVLDPDPAKRFQSAREFGAPVQRVLAVFDRAMEDPDALRASSVAPAPVAPSDEVWDTPAPAPTTSRAQSPAPQALKHTHVEASSATSSPNASGVSTTRTPFQPGPPLRVTAMMTPQMIPQVAQQKAAVGTPTMPMKPAPKAASTMAPPPTDSHRPHKGTLLMHAPTLEPDAQSAAPKARAAVSNRQVTMSHGLADLDERSSRRSPVSTLPPPA